MQKATDELASNVVKLMHKSDSLMKIAGHKTGVNVWDMPVKIADKDVVDKLEQALKTAQEKADQLEARFSILERDFCNQITPEDPDAARNYAEQRANLESRLQDVETALQGYKHTNPELRKSLNDTLSMMQTPVGSPTNKTLQGRLKQQEQDTQR